MEIDPSLQQNLQKYSHKKYALIQNEYRERNNFCLGRTINLNQLYFL